jgi:hypothetical protein
MRYAYLENGIVVDRVGNNPFLLFQPAYASQFIECPEYVDHNWTFDGENWYAPVITPQEKNAPILMQIQALEFTQARALREAALGMEGASDRLQEINNKISELRTLLLPL